MTAPSARACFRAATCLALIISWCTVSRGDDRPAVPDPAEAPNEVSVRDRGATGDGRTDDTHAIQSAIDAIATRGGEIYFPPGTYLVSAPIKLHAQSIYRGAGAGATALVTPTSGPGFAVFQVATPRTCRAGNGPCDGAIGSNRRGAACVCYDDDDCESRACTGGTVQRRLVVRDLEIRLQTSNSVGLDAALIGESTFRNLYIVAADGMSGTTGALFSDGNGKVSGYSDTLSECGLANLERGVLLLPRANDQRLVANSIDRCGIAILIRPTVNATHIVNNLLQSFTSHGIEDHGDGTCIIANRFEAGKPHIRLEADGSTAEVIANYHGGVGAPVENRGTHDALILENHKGSAVPGLLGNLAFESFNYAPRQGAPFPCASPRDGATYFDAGLHRMCICDGSRSKWCPLQLGGDTLACGSGTSCR
jgi:Pectate lyase superfamily protein